MKNRREFLKTFTALGVASALPISNVQAAYDPKAKYAIKVEEVDFRRAVSGRMLLARVYRPEGTGPFPMILDLHGGAWRNKDRYANEPMDRAVATSGAIVVAIDMTLSEEAPYPASVQDASYGIRWLKSKAAEWRGDPKTVGLIGSSTGGHIAELIAMRPRDARYNALAVPGGFDSTVAYVATRSPISDPFARYENAVAKNRESLIKGSKTYFVPWESIHEANPQQILDRKEPVTLVPLLIMQGELDDNVLPAVQEKFARTYRASGGYCDFQLFAGSEHEWTGKPGPQTDRAHEMVKAFVARNVK